MKTTITAAIRRGIALKARAARVRPPLAEEQATSDAALDRSSPPIAQKNRERAWIFRKPLVETVRMRRTNFLRTAAVGALAGEVVA